MSDMVKERKRKDWSEIGSFCNFKLVIIDIMLVPKRIAFPNSGMHTSQIGRKTCAKGITVSNGSCRLCELDINCTR